MMVNSWIRISADYWNTAKPIVIHNIPQILNNRLICFDRRLDPFSTPVE
jgi:hypothetical protein